MNWIKNVKVNVFPLSEEKSDIRKALDEWEYEGNVYDLEEPRACCELCDHPSIRYQFEIVNSLNGNSLLIGSECIIKWHIDVVDKSGRTLDSNGAKRKVHSDRGRLITEAKTRSVINSLLLLAKKDDKFDINSFIDDYRKYGAFTPKQLATVIWRLKTFKISYSKSYFKMTMKRNDVKQDFLDLKEWQIDNVWPCLSSYQKTYYKNNK